MSMATRIRRGRMPVAAGGALLASVLLLTACAGGSQQPGTSGGGDGGGGDDTTTIRLVQNNTVSSLTAVVASEKGFFEEQGLDVKADVVTDVSKVPPTLGNQYDIGFGVQPLVIRGAAQGLNTVVIAGNGASSADSPYMMLMTRPDIGIKEPEDLIGKTIAGPTLTGTHHTATLYWLQKGGVEASQVTSVQVATPSMIDQLEQGQIDVAELQEPFITEAKKRGLVEVDFSSAAVAPVTIESLWIAAPDWAEANDETVQKFRAALKQSVEWMADPANEAETKEILAGFTGQDPQLIEAAPLLNYKVEVTAEDLEVWGEAMKAVTDFSAEVDYESLIFPW
jgi:NitT/TauT family transport system substrate-binding protein